MSYQNFFLPFSQFSLILQNVTTFLVILLVLSGFQNHCFHPFRHFFASASFFKNGISTWKVLLAEGHAVHAYTMSAISISASFTCTSILTRPPPCVVYPNLLAVMLLLATNLWHYGHKTKLLWLTIVRYHKPNTVISVVGRLEGGCPCSQRPRRDGCLQHYVPTHLSGR